MTLGPLLIGNNNIGEKATDEDIRNVAKGCKRILDILKAKHPESKIVLFPLLPKGNKPGVFRKLHAQYNELIRAYADGTTVVWAPELWDKFLATADQDGGHPEVRPLRRLPSGRRGLPHLGRDPQDIPAEPLNLLRDDLVAAGYAAD